ncbi:MAG: site-specific integrase, partial [Candidatus Thermoplasmatota archaeon]|nr:site-specific integrase [Candidatus Thermoplasmatota archaeon]
MNSCRNNPIKKDDSCDYTFSIILKNANFNNIVIDYIFVSQKKEGGGSNQENKNCFETVLERDSENMDEKLQRYRKYLCGESQSQHTKDCYYSDVKQFLEIPNNTIDDETITDYKAFLNEKYQNKNTRNRKIIAVNQFFKWSKLAFWIKEIGWENAIKPTLKDCDIDKILEKTKDNPELYLMVLLLWDGCLRDESIINLKITDRNENRLYLDKTKTGKQSIILSNEIIKAYERYLKIR